jgi:hypothetical protein
MRMTGGEISAKLRRDEGGNWQWVSLKSVKNWMFESPPLRCETRPMPNPDRPAPTDGKRKTPPRTKRDGDIKAPKKSLEEEGLDPAHDFMSKFLKK